MERFVSVIAPMYNEQNTVEKYCEETLKVLNSIADYQFELILVNDGSDDNTYMRMLEEQSKNPEIITTICLSRNFGLEGAVKAGLQKAQGDAVIVMDADLQDPPNLIPIMIEKWENGADVVTCSRTLRRNDTFIKRIGAGVYYRVLDVLSGNLKLEKSAANFRLLSRKAIDQILELPEVNSVFRVVIPFIGMRTDVVEYERDKRFAGNTKYNLRKMIPYALNSITGISVEPLRKLSYLCLVSFILCVVFSVFAFLLTDKMWRVGTVAVAVFLFMFTLLFAGLSVIGEYIAQIMIEVKGRPLSIIYDYKPSGNTKRRLAE